MAVNYFSGNVARPRLKYRLISRWLKNIIIQHSKVQGDISYIFCDDNYLLDLNFRYLNHNYYTDIITFDYVEGTTVSGDIYISIERVKDNAVKFGVNLENEYLRVMVHGVLHLLSYNDKSDSEKEFMRNLESDYLALYKEMENDSPLKL